MSSLVAFTADADIYCLACAEARYGPDSGTRRDSEGNAVQPVFSDSEWDAPQHCTRCGLFIPVRLTGAGYDYVREQGANIPTEWRAEYTGARARQPRPRSKRRGDG